MAYDEIRVVYESMDEMCQTFNQGMEQLEDTNKEVQALAAMMEDGALLGRGGVAFVEAIRSKLAPAIMRLSEKFEELRDDVQDAKEYAEAADEQVKGMF